MAKNNRNRFGIGNNIYREDRGLYSYYAQLYWWLLRWWFWLYNSLCSWIWRHIWTFASSQKEIAFTGVHCFCSPDSPRKDDMPPSFVGNSYFVKQVHIIGLGTDLWTSTPGMEMGIFCRQHLLWVQ